MDTSNIKIIFKNNTFIPVLSSYDSLVRNREKRQNQGGDKHIIQSNFPEMIK